MEFMSTDFLKMAFTLVENDELNASLPDGIKPFGYREINNVPWIEFPGFSSDENFFAYKTIQETMMRSRNENGFKEVAVTYDKKCDPEKDGCAIVYGDTDGVNFCRDPKTREIINKSDNMTVIIMRNHPDDTGFSLNDIIAFCLIKNIKLMAAVKPSGKTDALFRTKSTDFTKEIAKAVEPFATLDINDPQTKNMHQKAKTALKEAMKQQSVIIIRNADKQNESEISEQIAAEYEKIMRDTREIPAPERKANGKTTDSVIIRADNPAGPDGPQP